MIITPTKDGSLTLKHHLIDEHYHSIHGALTESRHVFIRHGLEFAASGLDQLNILEVGLGTGLNALLTATHPLAKQININYTAIEPYPISMDKVAQLNYSELIPDASLKDYLLIHSCELGKPIKIGAVEFQKHQIPLNKFSSSPTFNLIYFDAFSPEKQPELWGIASFQKCYELLSIHGSLVTYCAKGIVKRTLKQAGFYVESLPGPPGKREMTRAIKR